MKNKPSVFSMVIPITLTFLTGYTGGIQVKKDTPAPTYQLFLRFLRGNAPDEEF